MRFSAEDHDSDFPVPCPWIRCPLLYHHVARICKETCSENEACRRSGRYRNDLRVRACLIQRLPLATLSSTRVSPGCSMTRARVIQSNPAQEESVREVLRTLDMNRTLSLPRSWDIHILAPDQAHCRRHGGIVSVWLISSLSASVSRSRPIIPHEPSSVPPHGMAFGAPGELPMI
jgi:hypothetical protein